MAKEMKKIFIVDYVKGDSAYSTIWYKLFLSGCRRSRSPRSADLLLLNRWHPVTKFPKPIIYFIDDLLWKLPQGYHPCSLQQLQDMTYWLYQSIRVVASTPYLATWLSLAMGVDVDALTVSLPDGVFRPDILSSNKGNKNGVVLSVGFYAHDHDIRDSGLWRCWGRLQRIYSVQVLGKSRLLGVHNSRPYSQYLTALRQFKLGLIPLQDHPFNYAKTVLKFLEYVVSGVVPIFSEIKAGEYAKLARKFPELVVKNGEWISVISRVLPKVEQLWPKLFRYCYDYHRHSVTSQEWDRILRRIDV